MIAKNMKSKLLLCSLILFCVVLCPVWVQASEVDTLRPVGDRATVTFWYAYPVDSSKWQCLNEVTADENVTYVWTKHDVVATPPARHGWYHTDFTVSDDIDSVKLLVRAKTEASGTMGELILGRVKYVEGNWSWCTNDDGMDTVELTSDYTDYSITWTNDPYDGSAWSKAKLNNTSRAWAWASKTVGADSDSFGLNSGASKWNEAANILNAEKFTSPASADYLTAVRIQVHDTAPAGSIRVAVYDDSSSLPKEPVWSSARIAVTNGVMTFSVSGEPAIEANTDYWLCYNLSQQDTISYSSGSGLHRWRYLVFSDAWPSYLSNTWTGDNQNQSVLRAIVAIKQKNIVTQSFIVVHYQAEMAEGNPRRNRILRMGAKR